MAALSGAVDASAVLFVFVKVSLILGTKTRFVHHISKIILQFNPEPEPDYRHDRLTGCMGGAVVRGSDWQS